MREGVLLKMRFGRCTRVGNDNMWAVAMEMSV